MSRYIDEKLTKLSLDIKDFNAKAKNAIETFGGISKAANKVSDSDMSGVTKSIGSIGTAAGNVNLEALGNAIIGISEKFSAVGVIAASVLNKITEYAISTGTQLAKQLTLQPVIDGFEEYETKLKSIQTITANTGGVHDLAEITDILDELNTYADKTIYNFGDMTRNIGTFTAAGVDLESSVVGIKGIANLAAMSGSSATQASTAMYQLSQAISAGVVRLQDWNSVVNAGMGGKSFQDALLRVAEARGEYTQAMMDDAGGFRLSLDDQWLSSDVLMETLEHYTLSVSDMTEAEEEAAKVKLKSNGYNAQQIEDIFKMGELATEAATKVRTLTQLIDTTKEALGSGWAKSLELLIGDFDQATELFTKISGIFEEKINSSADARNANLEEFASLGGRDSLVNSLFNIIEAIDSVMSSIGKGFRAAFPPANIQTIVDMVKAFEKFTEGLKLTEKQSETLANVIDFLGTILKTAWHMALMVAKAFKSILPNGSDIDTSILGVFSTLMVDLTNVGKAMQTGRDLGESWGIMIDNLIPVLQKFANSLYTTKIGGVSLQDIFIEVSKFFTETFGPVLEWIRDKIDDVVDIFWTFFDETDGKLKGFTNAFLKVKEIILEFFSSISSNVKDENMNPFEAFFESIKDIGEKLKEVWPDIKNAMKDFIPTMFEKIKEYFANVDAGDILKLVIAAFVGVMTKNLFGMGNDLKSTTKSVSGVAENIKESTDKIPDVLESVTGALNSFAEGVKVKLILAIAAAIALLAASLIMLSTVDSDKASDALASIALILGGLMGSLGILSKLDMKQFNFVKFTTVLIALVLSITILSSVVKKLGNMDTENLVQGVRSFIVVLASLTAAIFVLSRDEKKIGTSALTIGALAVAIAILASAVKKLGETDLVDLAKGLISVLALLAAMTLVSRYFESSKTTGMIALSAAILVMTSSVKSLGSLDTASLVKGLTAILAILTGLVIFTQTVQEGSLLRIASAMVILSLALMAITVPIKSLAGMDTGAMLQGLIGLVAVLTSLALFTTIVDGAKLMGVASAMVILSAALLIMVVPLKDMAALQPEGLMQGLLGILGLLTGIAVFTQAVSEASLLAMAVSMTILGAALILMSKPLMDIATLDFDQMMVGLLGLAGILGIMVLALNLAGGTMGAALGIATMAAAIMMLTPAIIALAQLQMDEIGRVVLILAAALGVLAVVAVLLGTQGAVTLLIFAASLAVMASAVLLAATGVLVFAAALTMIATVGTVAANVISLALESFIKTLGSLVVEIVKFVANLVVGMVVALSAAAPVLFLAIGELIIGMIQVMVSILPRAVVVIVELLVVLLEALGKVIQPLAIALIQFLIDVINAVANTIRAKVPSLVSAIFNFIEALLEVIIEVVLSLLDMALGWIPKVSEALDDMGNKATDALRNAFGVEEVAEDGMQDFVDAVAGAEDDARVAGSRTGNKTKTGVKEGLDGTADLGEESVSELLSFFDMSESGETGSKFGSSLLDGFGSNEFGSTGESGVSDLISQFTNSNGESKDTGSKFGSTLLDGFGTNDFSGTGESSVNDLLSQFTGGNETGSEFGGDILSGFDINDFLGTGDSAAKDTLEGVDKNQPAATNTGSKFAKEIIKGVDNHETDAENTGVKIGKKFNSGVEKEKNTGSTRKVGARLVGDVNSGILVHETDSATSGVKIGKKFNDGVVSKRSESKTSGATIAKAANEGFNSETKPAYSSGANFGSSIASGISSKKVEVSSAASGLATTANQSFKKTAQIASPSKVGIMLGGFYGIAVAMGIANKEEDVGTASENLAKTALDRTRMYAQMFTDQIVGNIDAEPVITPVLDMSNAQMDKLLDDSYVPVTFKGSTYSSTANSIASHAQDKMRGASTQLIQNDNSVHVDNKGLLDGATFVVREEADIEKIAKELDQRTYKNLKGAGYALQRN